MEVKDTVILRPYPCGYNQEPQRSFGLHKTPSYTSEENLEEEEKTFLWYVKIGDIDGIKNLLEENPNLDVNCCDYRGQRALDIAIGNHDTELVEFLLNELDVNLLHYYCAILKAVFENAERLLEMLLDRAKENEDLTAQLKDLIGGSNKCSSCLPQVAATNMTPIMAAAYRGNLEVTRMLIERGYCIQQPHTPKCRCRDRCHKKKAHSAENLTESINRINAYRGLTSPTYLISISGDPILTAFNLAKDTEFLSRELPENQKEYLDMSKQCSKFALDILNQCRDTEEIQTVLQQKEGFNDPRPHRFSRLHLAVQYGQKEFVTHSSCQQVLRSMWVDGLGSWYYWTFRERAFHVIKHALFTPFVCLGFIFIPKADVIYPLSVPLNRFIYAATSYLVFLSLLIVTLLNDRRYDMHSPATWTEIAVGCFVVASSFSIAGNLMSVGIKNYFRSWWCAFDLIMYFLFLVTEALWFSVFMYNCVYVSDTISTYNRMEWPWYHPLLLGEGVYAVASMMAFSRLLLWCHINSRVGPLGICIKYMITDVIRFFMVFFVIMFAFAIGINSIYKNYRDAERTENGKVVQQPESFLTLRNTFKSLFWAIFGFGEPDDADIIVTWNTTQNDTSDTDHSEHYFTEGVGYGLWGLYHLVTVVVLLNMLIAMMAESYLRVQENADIEWKFACSTLWLTTLDSHMIVPPPFNLIPSMHRMAVMCRWITNKTWKTLGWKENKVSWSFSRCCYWDPGSDIPDRNTVEEKYQKLLKQLKQRYLHSTDLRDASLISGIPVDLKEKLKSDIIHELRLSLIHI